MSTRRLHLDPTLAEAVGRARQTLESSSELPALESVYTSSLGAQERAAVATFLIDGTYRRMADAIARDDPDLADL